MRRSSVVGIVILVFVLFVVLVILAYDADERCVVTSKQAIGESDTYVIVSGDKAYVVGEELFNSVSIGEEIKCPTQ